MESAGNTFPKTNVRQKKGSMLAHTHVKIHERDKCQVDAMLVLVNLDMFAQFLAAWHTKIEPHKLPESAHPKVPC